MGRSPSSDESSGLKKGPWTPEEDDKLIHYIHKHGHASWRSLPKLAGLNRCGKSCRLRWTNYLRPDIKRGKFSQDEEQTILNLHSILGNKWSAIATHLPGRTDNEIKNYWNTHLKKKLIQMGFDPMTHQPRSDIFSTLPHLLALANLIVETNPSWEAQAMQLQAEAVHMARLNHCLHYILQPPPPPPPPPPPFQNGGGVSTNIIPDLASTLSLLNSLNEGSNNILSHHLEAAAAPPPPLAGGGYLQESAPSFSHLPDLQDFQTSFCGQGENSNSPSSPWMLPDLSASAAAPPTETSMTNITGGDVCSTSSYGGAQMWSELLDDPLFHEIA